MEDPLRSLERAASERDASPGKAGRAARGVVHTPAAIARWIARACPAISEETTLIDPACGPGVFLAAAVVGGKGQPGRCVGTDVDPAAIALAGRELAPLFAQAGWPLELHVRDALDDVPDVPGAAIVVGNPPWTARAASRGLTDALLDDFRLGADGEGLGERKIGVLSDSYVRFVRWAVAVVERAPLGGTVAMVVSSSFLDGRVHRGMRGYLLRAFDRLDLVDLGGSSLVARRAGARDENLFGVRPGAVILVGIRGPGVRERSARVRIATLRGSKADKLARLSELVPGDASFLPLAPTAPLHRFVTTSGTALPPAWPTLDAWMPWSREGVQTNRDLLCVDTDRDVLLARVRAFVEEPERGLERGHFDPRAAADRLRAEPELERFVVKLAYRPLDERWLFSHPAICHRARPEISAALAHDPLALVTAAKDRGDRPFAHLGVVATLADNCWLSSRSSCRARLCPVRTPDGRENVGPVRAPLEAIVGAISAHDVIAWLAAWLSAASFRARYDESLRTGPIRVPLPQTAREWREIVSAGQAMVAAFVGGDEGERRAQPPRPNPLPALRGEGAARRELEGGEDAGELVIGHRTLASPRARVVAAAQLGADALVRDLVGSGP